MKVTKLPYFFFFENKIDEKIENDTLTIKEQKYTLKKLNIALYLIFKYIPIAFFFLLIFNQYDFSLNNEKILQYFGAVTIFIITLVFNRFGIFISIVALWIIAILGVTEVLPIYNFDVAYIAKYSILLYTLYTLYTDTKKSFTA